MNDAEPADKKYATERVFQIASFQGVVPEKQLCMYDPVRFVISRAGKVCSTDRVPLIVLYWERSAALSM